MNQKDRETSITNAPGSDGDSASAFLLGAVLGVLLGALLGAVAARHTPGSVSGAIAKVPGKKSDEKPRFELLLQ